MSNPRSELTPLWRYRLGLGGIHAKYRFVPRSAIVDYPGLQNAVRDWRGEPQLQETIRALWKRHGAPSPAVIEQFLTLAGGLAAAPLDAQRQLLERWLDECRPRSRVAVAGERVETGIAFVVRRIRQRSFRRPLGTGRESLSSLRRAGVR